MVEELSHEKQEISHACSVLSISASGYYAWLSRPACARRDEDERLWQKIKQHWETSRRTYGRHRITQKLREDGEVIGKNRVEKIMKENEIQGVGKKKFKPQTTNSNHDLPVADRIFKTETAKVQVTKPNQYWGGDITYIPTKEGWLYLSIFLDLFTRKVVGHAMRDEMPKELIMESLEMALKRQGIGSDEKITAHSDRGSQYAADGYRKMLVENNVVASMSRRGNCYDNAFVESFFRTLKVELVYQEEFKTKKEAQSKIFEFIEVWYNRQRIHSSLDYMTPAAYEEKQLKAA